MNELLRCGNCAAPIHVEGDAVIVTCAFCGFQTRLEAPARNKTPPGTGPRLAEAIAIALPNGTLVPIVDAGSSVPTSRSETISTSQDDQAQLQLTLVCAGATLVRAAFALAQRKPRGTIRVKLSVDVDAHGAVKIGLAEQGSSNLAHYSGTVRIVS